MKGYEPSVTQWFCMDCLMLHANGEYTPREEDDSEPEPLSAIPDGWHATMGRAREEHECGRENGEDVDECECEDGGFSWSQCDGCGSWLGGDRHAFTLWIPVAA